jgi:hypothetical protein
MRIAAIVSCLATLVVVLVPAAQSAEKPLGSLEVTDGRGVITVKGRGALLGRLDRGSLTIVDLTPNDQWSPRVNGVPRGRLVGMRGRDVSFYIPAGRYRVVVRGEGINISARGSGWAQLDAQPDATGAAGAYTVGDASPEQLPDDPSRVVFGGTVTPPEPSSVVRRP